MSNLFRFLIFSGIFSLTISTFAQPNGGRGGGNWSGDMPKAKFFGQIVDAESNEPLEYATIALYSMRDSSLVSGGITDLDGKFMIETRPGRFWAKVEFISYQTQFLKGIRMGRESMSYDAGTITMQPDSEMLNEVEVRAEKSNVVFTLDKKVFNVGKDLANKGGTAEDILNNVPSVTVDIEGNVALRGSENVRILIDGRPSGLTGGLRQIPANMIESIEVVTNPSAKYEAEGMAGILNIVLKKDKKKGLNGSFDLTVGYPTLVGLGVNMNYRQKKFNFFVNYGINYDTNPGRGYEYRETYGEQTSIYELNRDIDQTSISNSIRFGADYFLNDSNTLTAAFLFRKADEEKTGINIYDDFLNTFDSAGFLQSEERIDDELEDERNLEYSLLYKKQFKKEKQVLTADVRYQKRREIESSDLSEVYYSDIERATLLPITPLYQRSANDEAYGTWILQTDYEHPIKNEGKIEAGWRSSFRNVSNDYTVEQQIDNEWVNYVLVGDSAWQLSNVFDYQENIHAAYGTYGQKFGNFSYQMGLRAELTDIATELRVTNERRDTTYLNFFPSAFLNYDLGGQNSIQLSYSRRIQRPRFWNLNPFFTFNDDRSFFSGNPNLNPEYTHSLELGHIKRWKKASLSSSVYYQYSTDVMSRLRILDQTSNLAVTTSYNFDWRKRFGLEFNINASPFDWWRLNAEFNFFNNEMLGTNAYNPEIPRTEVSVKNNAWTARLMSKKTVWGDVDFQIRANFRSPQKTVQGSREAIYSIDLGFSKDLLKKKATITLSVRDLLNSRIRNYEVDEPDFFSRGEMQWRSRVTTLTFSYRLNQQKRRGGNRSGGFDGGGGDF